MTTTARHRRQRHYTRRHVFRDWDILLLRVFVGLPMLVAVAYLIGLEVLRRWGVSVAFVLCVYRQAKRQKVPEAFYRAFEEEGSR